MELIYAIGHGLSICACVVTYTVIGQLQLQKLASLERVLLATTVKYLNHLQYFFLFNIIIFNCLFARRFYGSFFLARLLSLLHNFEHLD